MQALRLVFLVSCVLNCVHAVFDDEAYKTDWQVENIGHYECVLETKENTLVILSDYSGSALLSWVNGTDGRVRSRQDFPFAATDLMLSEDRKTITMKTANGYETIDSEYGFRLDVSVNSFITSCIPNRSGILISGNKVIVLDKSTGLGIFSATLPSNTSDIKYMKTDNHGHLAFLAEENMIYYYQEFHDGELSVEWVRDESLTDIVAYTHRSGVSPETSNSYNEWTIEEASSIPIAYFRRLKTNLHRLKNVFKYHRKTPGAMIVDALRDDDKRTIDEQALLFGFAKKLIVATRAGLVAEINAANGEKLWSISTGIKDITKLELLEDDSKLYVLTPRGISAILDLNTEMNPVFEDKSYEMSNTDIHRLGSSDSFYVKTPKGDRIIPMSGNLQVSNSVIVDHTSTSINAHIVKNDQVYDSWTIQTHENEAIVAFAPRSDEPVAKIGISLGNRTVLYKYLNPNLASYIVANEELNAITVNIIDVITGNTINSVYHEDVNLNKTVNLVFGENWIIYTYVSNRPIVEQRIVVTEMYESSTPNVRTSNSSTVFDTTYNDQQPYIISKSYIFSEFIDKLLISRTKYGVTTKAVVLQLENGQLSYLPKYILSARRIEESKMTKEDKQEFIAIPYVSAIPINDELVISHFRNIKSGKNAKLVSIPTKLESTSLICILGHDLFCTRIAPSSQFDLLSPGFEKGTLLLTILVLFFICKFLQPIEDTKRLKASWLVKE